ncbi:MAG: hypothetical protein AAGF75_03270 [Cyanobacteria bacterium P01_H01_bin.130]
MEPPAWSGGLMSALGWVEGGITVLFSVRIAMVRDGDASKGSFMDDGEWDGIYGAS